MKTIIWRFLDIGEDYLHMEKMFSVRFLSVLVYLPFRKQYSADRCKPERSETFWMEIGEWIRYWFDMVVLASVLL